MENIEKLVNEFLGDEGFNLRNALAYGGMGLSKTTGQANEIISGVGFAEQQYSRDRQIRMGEILGEMLFYWHVLASTIEMPIDEIIAQYVSSFEATRVTLAKDKVTIQDMMEMKKHVKASVLADLERSKDNNEKKKVRENMLMK
ncbi:MAG: hypothetical protein FWE45_00190 [Firmicutes bacterium]|nr:hypothetical protein [Bacillota bacterium]